MSKKTTEVQDNAVLREELERFANEQGIEIRQPRTEPAAPDSEAQDEVITPDVAVDPRNALYPGGVVPSWVQEARDAESGKTPRKRGRPKKGRGIRWKEIESLYVFGEPYVGEDGGTYVKYPTIPDLARRFRVTDKTLRDRSKRDQWDERRVNIEKRTEEIVEETLITQRAEKQIDARAAASEACDLLLAQFLASVHEGRVQVNSVKDFERLARLNMRLSGEADRTHDHNHSLTLEDLQQRAVDSRRRHRALPSDFGTAGRDGIPAPVALPIAVEPAIIDVEPLPIAVEDE